MKVHIFVSTDLISTVGFFYEFHMALANLIMPKKAAKLLLLYFMRKLAAAGSKANLSLKEKSSD